MSIRAWLARRQIRKLFRPKALAGADAETRMRHFKKALEFSEPRMPKPPASTCIEPVDEQGVKGEWVWEPGTRSDHIIFYMHGGGYVWGGPVPYRDLGWRLSKAANARVFLLDYRLAPGAKCPAPIEDALAAYKYLLTQEGGKNPIMCAGDSAGGGLTLATAHAIRDAGLRMPGALALISPWVDITGGGNSILGNNALDVMLDGEGVGTAGRIYAGDMPLTDPRCSPLFGNQKGLPPTLIQVGSTEILLDDSTRLDKALTEAGVEHRLDVWPKMHHVWHMSAKLVPEGKRAIADIAAHFNRVWGA